ncbi:7-carboxy-7-deazaguanine synthase QueE [Roseiconus nitratireducens]|uniref:7-carboxy-7-deazaguanine synthase n=1 Tax=Roseiconus nitratireducens TaxID=2605748 RepID=A0A5M6DJ76_9BACT|nr:7-carboxy-7-deazaguanine synthase QueE [Roseiconus nitratireducens]
MVGTESFFIRTSGCNLRCWFCDTPYASWHPEGQVMAIDALVDRVHGEGPSHVVLTGGEPLLPAAAVNLSQALMDAGFHLTIETAGTIDKPIACDLLSLSPKLGGSAPDPGEHPRWNRLHEERRLPLETMQRLIHAARDFQVKFVVNDQRQFDEAAEIAEALDVKGGNVFIMPQGTTLVELDRAESWLRPLTESVGYHYCDRMQIRWYGNRRGT